MPEDRSILSAGVSAVQDPDQQSAGIGAHAQITRCISA